MKSFLHIQPTSHTKKHNYAFTNEILGRGGYSEVRKAEWNGQGSSRSPMPPQTVAVKVVLKSVVRDKVNYGKILQVQLERIRNEHSISLFDWFESSTKYYVIFELLQGELFDHLVEKPYSERDALQVIRDLVDLLVILHDEIGIIHRDIKPENFLLRNNDYRQVVLTDYGIAKVLSGPQEREKLVEICGTPGYAAPEIYKQTGYDRKCDIFSLGVFTFALLTAWSPWNASGGMDLVKETMTAPIEFSPSRWRNISQEARQFILATTERDPTRRLSAAECQKHVWLSLSHDEVEQQPVPVPESENKVTRVKTLKPEDLEHPLVRKLTLEGVPE